MDKALFAELVEALEEMVEHTKDMAILPTKEHRDYTYNPYNNRAGYRELIKVWSIRGDVIEQVEAVRFTGDPANRVYEASNGRTLYLTATCFLTEKEAVDRLIETKEAEYAKLSQQLTELHDRAEALYIEELGINYPDNSYGKRPHGITVQQFNEAMHSPEVEAAFERTKKALEQPSPLWNMIDKAKPRC